MTPAERFTSSFLRPFSDKPEVVARAEEEFASGLDTTDPVLLEAAADRFDHMDRRPSWRRWLMRTGWLAALVIWLAEAASIGRGPGQLFRATSNMGGNHSLGMADITGIFAEKETLPRYRLQAGISQQDHNWLLLDDHVAALAAKARWEAQPDDPESFTDYIQKAKAGGLPLTEDLPAAATKIDPDNGWPLFLIGCGRIGASLREVPIRGKSGYTVEVRNRDLFNEGLALSHQAAARPVFRNYRRQLFPKRIALLADTGDALGQVERFYVGPSASPSFQSCAKGLGIEVEAAAKEGRNEIVRQMAADWAAISRALANEITTQLDALNLLGWVGAGEKIRDVCRMSGEEAEAAKIDIILTSPALAQLRGGIRPDIEWISEHVSDIAPFAIPYRSSTAPPPELFDAQRKIIRTIFDRAQMWNVMTGFIVLAGLIHFVRLRCKRPLKRVAGRFGSLLNGRDDLWILRAGILLSFAVMFVLARLSSLGGAGYSPQGFMGHGMIVQSSVGLLFVFAMFMEMTRWRMEKRIGPLLNRLPSHPIIPFILPCLCLMAVIGVGIQMKQGEIEVDRWEQAVALLGVAALVRFFSLAFGPKAAAVFRIATLEAMLPGCLVAALLAAAPIPFFIHAERHWVAVDPLFDRNPEYLGFGKFHHDEVERMRRLLIEATGSK